MLLARDMVEAKAIFVMAFIAATTLFGSVVLADNKIKDRRKVELENLLLQDCGSCHGMTLKGGIGPALTPDIMNSRSREFLFTTISEGRPGTPMPPWKTFLSSEEINWIIDTLYHGVEHDN